ncbi:MAG: quinol:electron acceptor oxidoreductase subunit ActD, partial [bacterium]
TVFGMFALARLPRLTLTVGYDPRFSSGHFGVWVSAGPDRAPQAAELLRSNGAVEVRNER